jgi:hypothetical protein
MPNLPFRKKALKEEPEKKNPFQGSIIIDNPDVKVVEARYNDQPFFIGAGVSTQRDVKGSAGANIPDGIKGEYESQKDLKWEIYVNLHVLPPGFVPADKVNDFVASAASFISGNAVVSGSTIVVQTDAETLETQRKNPKHFVRVFTESLGVKDEYSSKKS